MPKLNMMTVYCTNEAMAVINEMDGVFETEWNDWVEV